MSQIPLHVLASILAASRVSGRTARAICNGFGFGGGSKDLAAVLGAIESSPQRAEIERIAAASNPLSSPTNPPHERFVFGMGESGRQYVTHTRNPRFVAELFDEDDPPPVAGITMAMHTSGEVAGNFAWIDAIPTSANELLDLRNDLESALEENDFRADADVDAIFRAESEEQNDKETRKE